jgi:solute carrier family 9 (sodium/hydrogen exchanger), member 6/7
MSRRTQLTTKFLFQVLAQLSENFIFIYLGLTLFTETDLDFKPIFILITVVGICAARWLAVFPLSRAINWFIRYRAKRKGKEVADELPYPYQAMLFWAGLRGAVGVALAAGLQGTNGPALRATVLVVVVLTVIIFGSTTASMLEILGIQTGVVEEMDSDDEFDIETGDGGTYYKRSGTGLGHNPRRDANVALNQVDRQTNGRTTSGLGYSSSNRHSPPIRPSGGLLSRKNSSISQRDRDATAENLLHGGSLTPSEDDEGFSDGDLPPAAKKDSRRRATSPTSGGTGVDSLVAAAPGDEPTSAGAADPGHPHGSIRDLFSRPAGDRAAWFRQLDEDFIKPTLLLDQGKGGSG